MKKVVCLYFSIIVLVSAFFLLPIDAKASSPYNPEYAISFAREHWDDGVGKCANYVSKCLNEGGLSVAGDTPKALLDSLKKGSGTVYSLSANKGNVKVTTGKVAYGDPIFIYCSDCKSYPHVVLCGGNKDGYVTYYAHNEPSKSNPRGGVGNTKKLNLNWSSGDHAGHSLVAKVFHIESVTLDGCRINLSSKSMTYGGKKPTVSVKNGFTTLKENIDFTVDYSLGKVGKGTITVNGIGQFCDDMSFTIAINPRPVAQEDFSLTTKSRTISVACKTKAEATHYELVYSTDSKFKKDTKTKQLIVPKGFPSITFSIDGLKSGKTYYVKLRSCTLMPFCDNNGDIYYYSSYCEYKSIKAK